jgi:D-aminoacyl-tRNA deacylase
MGDPDAHRDVLTEAFAASDTEFALVEGTKPGLERVLEDLGFRVVSETWLREVGARDLEAVAAVEAELGSVEDGVRFGDRDPGRGADASDSWTVRDLPNDLVDAARSVDDAETRRVVDRVTVAFQTRNNGSQVQGRAILPDGAAYDALVDGLVDVIRADYDEVRREPDRVVATTDAFDPVLASDAGVPEGPKFGRLAAGDAVTVDGDRIDPTDVSTHREDVFEI